MFLEVRPDDELRFVRAGEYVCEGGLSLAGSAVQNTDDSLPLKVELDAGFPSSFCLVQSGFLLWMQRDPDSVWTYTIRQRQGDVLRGPPQIDAAEVSAKRGNLVWDQA